MAVLTLLASLLIQYRSKRRISALVWVTVIGVIISGFTALLTIFLTQDLQVYDVTNQPAPSSLSVVSASATPGQIISGGPQPTGIQLTSVSGTWTPGIYAVGGKSYSGVGTSFGDCDLAASDHELRFDLNHQSSTLYLSVGLADKSTSQSRIHVEVSVNGAQTGSATVAFASLAIFKLDVSGSSIAAVNVSRLGASPCQKSVMDTAVVTEIAISDPHTDGNRFADLTTFLDALTNSFHILLLSFLAFGVSAVCIVIWRSVQPEGLLVRMAITGVGALASALGIWQIVRAYILLNGASSGVLGTIISALLPLIPFAIVFLGLRLNTITAEARHRK